MKNRSILTIACLITIIFTSISTTAYCEDDPFADLGNTENLELIQCDSIGTGLVFTDTGKVLLQLTPYHSKCSATVGMVKVEIMHDSKVLKGCLITYLSAAHKYLPTKCDISDIDESSIQIHHKNKAGNEDIHTKVNTVRAAIDDFFEESKPSISSDKPTFTRATQFELKDGAVFRCLDGDGDGVCDSNDDCDDTPTGDEVDEVGCTVEEITPPETDDVDGDSVLDEDDNCPLVSNADQGR